MTAPATTYIRHTMERLTAETCKPGQDSSAWDYVHLMGMLSWLDARGHGDLLRQAADAQATYYGLPPQTRVDAGAEQ